MRLAQLKRLLFTPLLAAVTSALVLNEPLLSLHQAAVTAQAADQETEADRLLKQGNRHFSVSQYQAALQAWQAALKLYRQNGDRQGEANALGKLGAAYTSLSQYPKAIDFYQQALKIKREIGDRKGEAGSLGNLAITYASQGQYSDAIEMFQQVLEITQQIGDREGELGALNNLGLAHYYLSQFQTAIEFYQKSLLMTQEVGSRRGEAASLDNLGLAYAALGKYPKAIEFHQRSLAIERENGNRDGEAGSLNNLGLVYYYLGQHQQAIEFHRQSLAIKQEIGDREGEAKSLGNLGIAYYQLDQYQTAIEFHLKSLAISSAIDDRLDAGLSLGNLGNAYYALGQYEQAIEFHQKSLASKREIGDRQGESGSLGSLGSVYNTLGQYQQAIEFHQKALAIDREIGDLSSEGGSLNNLGLVFENQGQFPKAEQALRAAIGIWEQLRQGNIDQNKVSLFEKQATSYRTLQRVLVAQDKTNAALEISERGLARAFVELLASRLKTDQQSATIPLPTINTIREITGTQDATLVQYSLLYQNTERDGRKQAQAATLYIWVVSPGGDINFRSVDLSPLQKQQNTTLAQLVSTSRDTLGVRSRSDSSRPRAMVDVVQSEADRQRQRKQHAKQLRQLHQVLIEPIAQYLPADPSQRVIFIPQGSLFLVPFPALLDARDQPLIKHHTILNAPSIQVLAQTHQFAQRLAKSGAGNQAVVLGNPTMPKVRPEPGAAPQQLSPLPGAEQEAIAIAPLLKTQAITGPQATEAAIVRRLPQAGIIHLATHGLLDDERGLGSAIALAPEPGQPAIDPFGNTNGLLTAEEILDLDLQAGLVVLSACDTGRGRITGDGVIGLSRSFISAGVPSLIVSLWAVPDAPTADLMKEFYTNWKLRDLDKAQALRQAMLTTMEDHPDPKDWAAFTLIGEAQ